MLGNDVLPVIDTYHITIIVLITVGHFIIRPCKNFRQTTVLNCLCVPHQKLTTTFILTLNIFDCGFQFTYNVWYLTYNVAMPG